jgi:hypothetical protein
MTQAQISNILNRLRLARGHLGSAVCQRIPSDDSIIADHVDAAYRLIGEALDEMREERAAVDAASLPPIHSPAAATLAGLRLEG